MVTSRPTPTPIVPRDGRGGGVIVFSSDQDGNDEIYTMNADGSGRRRLTRNPATDGMPNWSPDGAQIAFYSYRPGPYYDGKPNAVYVVDVDGSNLRQLTELATRSFHPVWHP
jgi:Tol biopolymer transport system component